jgi:hypothetical protein
MLPLLSTTVDAPGCTEPCRNAAGTTPSGVPGACSVVAENVEPATSAIESRSLSPSGHRRSPGSRT